SEPGRGLPRARRRAVESFLGAHDAFHAAFPGGSGGRCYVRRRPPRLLRSGWRCRGRARGACEAPGSRVPCLMRGRARRGCGEAGPGGSRGRGRARGVYPGAREPSLAGSHGAQPRLHGLRRHDGLRRGARLARRLQPAPAALHLRPRAAPQRPARLRALDVRDHGRPVRRFGGPRRGVRRGGRRGGASRALAERPLGGRAGRGAPQVPRRPRGLGLRRDPGLHLRGLGRVEDGLHPARAAGLRRLRRGIQNRTGVLRPYEEHRGRSNVRTVARDRRGCPVSV
ncbi:MAG: hypothetical protein AVDCRST_MAG25-286, partial [uncultured Rubrobacteraceae bacterium]